MPRFDFKSTGGEFTDSMTELLARRKAEERQVLLDSLSQNADTRAAHADARAAEEAKHSELTTQSNLANDKQAREIARAQALFANRRMGDDISDLSPEDIEIGKRYGNVSIGPSGPDTSATITGMQDESGQAPTDFSPIQQVTAASSKPRYTYAGNTKEREKEAQRKANGAIISRLLKDPKDGGNPEDVKAGMYLAQRMAANDGIIPDEAWKETGVAPPQHVNIFHQSSGTFTDGGTVPSNSQTVTQGYAPRELRGPTWIDNGINEETGQREYIDPENNTVRKFNGNRKGADNSESALGVPQGTIQNYLANVSSLKEQSTYLGIGDNTMDPGTLQATRLAAGAVIGAAKVSGNVRIAAHLAINDPDAFDKRFITGSDLTDREHQQLSALLAELMTPEIKELFRKYPANKPKANSANSGGHTGLTELLLNRSGGGSQ